MLGYTNPEDENDEVELFVYHKEQLHKSKNPGIRPDLVRQNYTS